MPSSKPRALSRDIILSAALELVDEEGLSALSLRSLGKRLGVSQAAFYRHIPDKAALLEGISEQVWRLTFDSFLARVEGGKVGVQGAPQAASASPLLAYMREYAHCLAATLRVHPGTVMLLLTHPMSTPEQLSQLARVFVALARRGFTPNADMLGLVNAVSIYTTAFVAAEVVPPVGGTTEQPVDLQAASAALSPEDAQALRPLIQDLLEDRYDFVTQFERGLEAILRGWN
ncbi:TetR/AcrR family transcriptional regulator [Actinomyces sp.]